MPLLSQEDVKRFAKTLGSKAYEDLKYRRTGKSTRIALRTILEALENPGKPILIKDHHGTREADKMLMRMVMEMAGALRLDHLNFNATKLTITFVWENPLA